MLIQRCLRRTATLALAGMIVKSVTSGILRSLHNMLTFPAMDKFNILPTFIRDNIKITIGAPNLIITVVVITVVMLHMFYFRYLLREN
jgi:hypothetical protein